jgi:4-hydroxy-tetrahydrodipicolinate reductase
VPRVAVVGATGKMGTIATATLLGADDVELRALVSRHRPTDEVAPWHAELAQVPPDEVDLVVDLSVADVAARSIAWACEHRKDAVVGTSGLADDLLAELAGAASQRARVLVVPNFSIGAVLCQRFAAEAAPYFRSVEVIELHHDEKRDAPSGTSIATARAIAAARRSAGVDDVADPTTSMRFAGARGAEVDGGVRVHSVRLAGLLAHQEVHFGAPGEGLVVRHDSYDRSSFMAGLLLAVRRIDRIAGLEVGLERVLDT